MKLYIAKDTGARAAQVVAHELGLALDLVYYDTRDGRLSDGGDFAAINPLRYVPVLDTGEEAGALTETAVILGWLAERHRPRAGES